jgi:hypothetical protein
MSCINKTKYAEIGRKMREIPLERPVTSYEWEELVEKLCTSDDAELQDIGNKEFNKLKNNCSKHSKKQE